MDTATQDLFYQRITELIYDEEKIVTAPLLASSLKISGNEAQNLLHAYVKEQQPLKSDALHATYLLCGTLQENQALAVSVEREEDLSEKKSLFSNIATEVVFSVQKGKLVDFNMVALTNSPCMNGLSSLASKNCIKRNIKPKKLPIIQPSKQSGTLENSGSHSSGNTHESSKGLSQTSQKQNKGKQGGLASFFAKAATKTQNTVKTETASKVEPVKPSVDQTKTNGDDPIKTNGDICNEKKEDNRSFETSNALHEDKQPSSKSQEEVNKKKRKKENKNKGPNKKRKRIQQICDSDSSDMFDDGEIEDVIEMSDDEPTPAPAPKPSPVPKNKKRKAIDKTFADDDGFIVTTTEYVYETASEEEEEKKVSPEQTKIKILPEKKKEKVNEEPKKPGNKTKTNKKQPSGKQPTLMSFFKKS